MWLRGAPRRQATALDRTHQAEASEGIITTIGRDDLLPPVTHLRTVSATVAIAVAQAAEKEGLAQSRLDNPVQQVKEAMWRPQYPSIEAI